MFSTKISLNSISKIKEFVKIVDELPIEIDLVNGKYVVDAKSIMGIFSLDLIRPIRMNVYTEKEEEFKELCEKINSFLVKE